jgi:hypothetical protein
MTRIRSVLTGRFLMVTSILSAQSRLSRGARQLQPSSAVNHQALIGDGMAFPEYSQYVTQRAPGLRVARIEVWALV